MTLRSREPRNPEKTWCSEAHRGAFVSRRHTEYRSCAAVAQPQRKTPKKPAASCDLDTVAVTFVDHPSEQEPSVSTERVEQDSEQDFPGVPVLTIVFSAMPAPAFGMSCPAETRRMSPYGGVTSLGYGRALPVALAALHAPR
jgi:hypothetical protein